MGIVNCDREPDTYRNLIRGGSMGGGGRGEEEWMDGDKMEIY